MTSNSEIYRDIVHRFGPLADHLVLEIIGLKPEKADLDAASAYMAGMTDVLGEARRPLTGKAAKIYDIVRRDEMLDEEEKLGI